jgi:Putative ATPase subunit of terminase (gpP-like)
MTLIAPFAHMARSTHALARQGWTISAIARHLGRDRKTIRAYLRGDREAGIRAPAAADPFGPFAAYCAARLTEDPHLDDLFVCPAGAGGETAWVAIPYRYLPGKRRLVEELS